MLFQVPLKASEGCEATKDFPLITTGYPDLVLIEDAFDLAVIPEAMQFDYHVVR